MELLPVMDAISVFDSIFSFCKLIHQLVGNVTSNKDRCKEIGQRVRALEDLVLTIKRRGQDQISDTVYKALWELNTILASAKKLISKYTKANVASRFLKSGSQKDNFCKMDKRLTDSFQVLSGALLIEQGNVLNEVYGTLSGRRQCPANSTSRLPLPSDWSPSPLPLPTAPLSPPCIMPTSPLPLPTAPLSPPCIMPTSPLPYPTVSFPLRHTMPTSPLSYPTVSLPLCHTMPASVTPMPLTGTVSPIGFSTTVISKPAIVPTFAIPLTPKPNISIVAPTTVSVVRSYVVSSSSFS